MRALVLSPDTSETALRRMGGAKIGSVSMRKSKVNLRMPPSSSSGSGVDAGPSIDGDRLRISQNEKEEEEQQAGKNIGGCEAVDSTEAATDCKAAVFSDGDR